MNKISKNEITTSLLKIVEEKRKKKILDNSKFNIIESSNNQCYNKNKKKKSIIDDGMNKELVIGAEFDGYLGVPTIEKPERFIIPTSITPFKYRDRIKEELEAIGFNEMDTEFADILAHPEKYKDEFNGKIIISPDCSLYRDAPLAVQIANIYKNRAIGYFFQKNGAYIIPQIRWGNRFTYTKELFLECVAFLGVRKHSIVAIGTYGCIKSQEDKIEFKNGLRAMLEELEPEIVLVYGRMPAFIFDEFKDKTTFIRYEDWITRCKGGNR